MNTYVDSIKPTWQNTKFVSLNEAALEKTAQEFAKRELSLPDWRSPILPAEDDETFLEFIGVSSAIDFCFTDFNTHKNFDVEYPQGSGHIWYSSDAMTASLMRALDEGIPILDPGFLAHDLNEKMAALIFQHVTTPIPMLKERVENLKDVGYILGRKLYGIDSFDQLFRQADYRVFNNGRGIAEVLPSIFKSYRDFTKLQEGGQLQFYKRAQLLPMIYHGRSMASNGALALLKDPESIGPITDYQVPKVLRSLGILYYHPKLASKIDKGQEIPENSQMDIEIRVQTTHGMCKLLKRINLIRPADKQITMPELDYPIWSAGEVSQYRHHYTRTTNY